MLLTQTTARKLRLRIGLTMLLVLNLAAAAEKAEAPNDVYVQMESIRRSVDADIEYVPNLPMTSSKASMVRYLNEIQRAKETSEASWLQRLFSVPRKPAQKLSSCQNARSRSEIIFETKQKLKKGSYTIMTPTIMSPTIELAKGLCQKGAHKFSKGDIVEIIDVQETSTRIRGQVANPKGWISLQNKETGFMWAHPGKSAVGSDKSNCGSDAASLEYVTILPFMSTDYDQGNPFLTTHNNKEIDALLPRIKQFTFVRPTSGGAPECAEWAQNNPSPRTKHARRTMEWMSERYPGIPMRMVCYTEGDGYHSVVDLS